MANNTAYNPNTALANLLKNVRLPRYGNMRTHLVEPDEYTLVDGRAQVAPSTLSRIGAVPSGSGPQPLRQAAEDIGGVVRWQGQGQPIQVTTGSRILDMTRQAASALGGIAKANLPDIPAGTPTLSAMKFAEEQRRFEEGRRAAQAALALGGTRQAASAAPFTPNLLGKTAGERSRIFTSQAMESAINQYQQEENLESTLNYILTDPQMRQMGVLGGADLPAIADYLVGATQGVDFLSYLRREDAYISQRMNEINRSLRRGDDPNAQADLDSLYQRLFSLQTLGSIYNSTRQRQPGGMTQNLDQPLQ